MMLLLHSFAFMFNGGGLVHCTESQGGKPKRKLKLHSCFSTVWPELLIFEVLDKVDFIDRGDEDVNGDET